MSVIVMILIRNRSIMEEIVIYLKMLQFIVVEVVRYVWYRLLFIIVYLIYYGDGIEVGFIGIC